MCQRASLSLGTGELGDLCVTLPPDSRCPGALGKASNALSLRIPICKMGKIHLPFPRRLNYSSNEQMGIEAFGEGREGDKEKALKTCKRDNDHVCK